MAGALQNTPPPTSSHQLGCDWNALQVTWKVEVSCTPCTTDRQPSSVRPTCVANSNAQQGPGYNPSSKSHQQPVSCPGKWWWQGCTNLQKATLTRLVFDTIASPSGPNTIPRPSPLPLSRVSITPSPIAHCTRSHLAPPHHSSLAALVQYHIPFTKTTRSQLGLPICQPMPSTGAFEPESTEFACLCARLTSLNKGHSLAVLDKKSGQLLEYCQPRQDPRYKEVWDWSYSNELGRLCHGIGTGDKAGGKQVAGTNTFHVNQYSDIPHHKHKEVIHIKVVYEIQEGKDNKKCTRITVGRNLIFYPGDAGTNTALLELIKLMLNSVISCKGAQFLTIDI